MPIPDYESLMLPTLETIADGRVYHKREVEHILAQRFNLTEEELQETVASGSGMFAGRVHWAIQYMLNARLVQRPQRAHVQLTERGREVLAARPKEIDSKFLTRYSEFVEWAKRSLAGSGRSKSRAADAKQSFDSSDETPDERISSGYVDLRTTLASDILDLVKSCSPRFFERLVVKLLVRMGYGGSEQEAIARVVGKSGDGGIDGIIQEDRLGLDAIYIQAKRWDGPVGAGTVRDFSGSLDTHGAKKGVLITTSHFTDDARKFVSTARTDKKVVLIDGARLADLMIDHDVGVSLAQTYTIKRIDSDFFEEE